MKTNFLNKNIHLSGEKISLRKVAISDVNRSYISWLNSGEINQFLESRFSKHTITTVKEYVKKMRKDRNSIFLAIIRNSDSKHIGNIKLGPIDWNHKNADIGIMIGDKNSWGKGYATEAIALLSDFAFQQLNLHKLLAGAYENNLGSINAFKKVGFHEEGKLQEHFLFKGKYIDGILLSKKSSNS